VTGTARVDAFVLTTVGLACASASSAAFFLHVLGWLPMPFFVNFVGLPAIIGLLVVAIYSWNRQLPFSRYMRAGIAAGATGLLAYDGVRYVIHRSGILDYDPFHAIPILGSLITSQPPSATASAAAGWLYHVWNGFSFAIIYALIAGPARWTWGLAWAMVLEIAMLLTYPAYLGVRANAPLVIVSLIGHAAYGSALGVTVRRLARGEER
jgi:hypothetical protein